MHELDTAGQPLHYDKPFVAEPTIDKSVETTGVKLVKLFKKELFTC